MSFLDDEGSVEASQPREGIAIRLPLEMVRIATGTRDITINGQRYVAGPSAREEVRITTSENQNELIIRMPMAHRVPQRWLAQGSPPKAVEVSLYRLQLRSGEYRRRWNGYITSLSSTDNNTVALIHVRSRMTATMDRRLSRFVVGRSCPFILYDADCQVDRDLFKVSTTVATVQGRRITVASIGGKPNDWATFGEVLHTASGERMTIESQVGTTIDMQRPIVELKIGDAVDVFAGCQKDITTCGTSKFNNRQRFGGIPMLNADNPQVPTGFGVKVSS